MARLIDRLPILLEQWLEMLPTSQSNAKDKEKDKDGTASVRLASDLRFIGVAKYILNNDVKAFQENLREAARIRNQLFIRFESGEAIARSYISMLSYKYLFNALAAGEFVIARDFASNMGGRDKIEKYYDHPFDYRFGYALKSFVLKDRPEMKNWSSEFSEICRHKSNINLQGYAWLFEAILNGDTKKADDALSIIVNGHMKLSKGRGLFKDTDDEVLCVWGIGMANLAKMYSIDVQPRPPLIPADLVVARHK